MLSDAPQAFRIRFKRWSRHAYAVFSSLNKQIAIGVLCVSCSIIGSSVWAFCPADTLESKTLSGEYELEEVIISAPQNPLIQSDLMRSVTIISRQEIELAPAQDLSSLLNFQAGVDLRQRGSFGMQADLSLRGGSFDQTLVLLNGIPMNDPQTGHHSLHLPFDLQSVERIEILHGAAARIYGPNAFSGAVNIITRVPDKSMLQTMISAGEHGYGMAAVFLGMSGKRSRHFLSLSGMKADGYTNNTDFSGGSLYYRTLSDLEGMTADMQLGYSHRAFGANSFYTPLYPDQFEHTRTAFFSFRLSADGLPLEASFYWRRHYDRFELFRYEAPEWYTGHNYHRSDVRGGSLQYHYTGRFGLSSLGLDVRMESIQSNVLGLPLAHQVSVSRRSQTFYTHAYQRNGLSVMAGQSIFLGPLSMAAGLLAYFSSELGYAPALFPGIDLAWQFSRQIRVYASGNHTLRLPTFTDLFYSGPVNLGNAELTPEKALSIETGIKGAWALLHYEGFLFKRWGREMIDWVMYPGDGKWRSENLTQVNISGLGVIIYIPLLSGHSTSDHAVGESLKFSYHFTTGEKQEKDFISNYVLDQLKHHVVLSASSYFTSRLGLSMALSWQDREGRYINYQDGAYAGTKAFEPYWMLDARIFYDTGSLQWFAEASNVFNTEIVNHANVPQPGRWFRAGVKSSFLW